MTKREFRYHRHKKYLLDWFVPALPRSPNDRICENEGCSHFATVQCELDYFNEETKEWEVQTEWLCTVHAEEEGYCIGCGTFISGTGMEFTNNGYCDNCRDQIDDSRYEEEDLDY